MCLGRWVTGGAWVSVLDLELTNRASFARLFTTWMSQKNKDGWDVKPINSGGAWIGIGIVYFGITEC